MIATAVEAGAEIAAAIVDLGAVAAAGAVVDIAGRGVERRQFRVRRLGAVLNSQRTAQLAPTRNRARLQPTLASRSPATRVKCRRLKLKSSASSSNATAAICASANPMDSCRNSAVIWAARTAVAPGEIRDRSAGGDRLHKLRPLFSATFLPGEDSVGQSLPHRRRELYGLVRARTQPTRKIEFPFFPSDERIRINVDAHALFSFGPDQCAWRLPCALLESVTSVHVRVRQPIRPT